LKRLLDAWDRNGSTGSPTWLLHDDDVLPATSTLAQQWAGIVDIIGFLWLHNTIFSWCNHGNQVMYQMQWNYIKVN
jgi:hypothetical protein